MASRAAKRRALMIADGLIIAGLCLVALLSLAGHLREPAWWLAILSQPRMHFLCAAMLATAWFLTRERRIWSVVALAVALLNLVALAPFFFDQEKGEPGNQTLTVLHLNTSRGAADLSQVESFAADLVCLQEVTPQLEAALAQGGTNYRIVRSEALENTHGSAILIRKGSPIQVLGSALHHLPETNQRPLLSIEISLDGRRVQLLSLHVIRPRNRGTDADHQIEFDAVAAWSRKQIATGREVVMIGDFNATPWSRRFKKFLTDSQTYDSMLGFGIQNSWSAIVPGWMGLPIDHAVYSSGLQVTERQTVDVEDADHRLMLVRFALANP